MGVTAAVVAIAGAAYSYEQQRKAASAQERALREQNKIEEKRADITTARERAKQVREARAQRARALAQAQSGAGTGGSGLTGAQANINNAATGNLVFLGQQRQISSQLSDLNIRTTSKINELNNRAAQGQLVTKAATSVGGVA